MTKRLFYGSGYHNMQVIDCDSVESSEDGQLYHNVNDGEPTGIRVLNDGCRVLDDCEVTDSVKSVHVHDKHAENEVYIFGGMASSTDTKFHYMGDVSGSSKLEKYESGVRVRVNSTVALGVSNSVTSEWEWEIVSEGDATVAETSDELSDILGVEDSVIIGYNKPIERFEKFRNLI